MIIVNVDDYDFENSAEALGIIIDRIRGELHGLFTNEEF